jgi:hypothetical protein
LLLPVLGLCSCASVGERLESAAPEASSVEAPAWTELDPGRAPMSVVEAMIRSGHRELAAGDYRAAEASFALAIAREPTLEGEIRLDQADALAGQGRIDEALALVRSVDTGGLDSLVTAQRAREVALREARHFEGTETCELVVEDGPRPLDRRSSMWKAWDDLRGGLEPAAVQEIPLGDDWAAERALCGDLGCLVDEPQIVRIDGDGEISVGLVVAHEDGELSVLPELLHLRWDTCDDDEVVHIDRPDPDRPSLVRVRAFSDLREEVEYEPAPTPEELVAQVTAPTPPSPGYAGSSYASSGYASSGYASSGYYYGCGGGYEYADYAYCEARSFVERDVFIDLAREEVVLDITRTGPLGAALGSVRAEGQTASIDACGARRTLELAWTAA